MFIKLPVYYRILIFVRTGIKHSVALETVVYIE